MGTDNQRLKQFVQEQSESAFEELVTIYVDMVYSVARRQLGGDSHLAKDITQQVFLDLAAKAPQLLESRSLASWLYQRTRYASLNAIRTDRRRKAREEESTRMNSDLSSPVTPGDEVASESWPQLEPVLDEALSELPGKDRQALLLRFFRKAKHRQIAEEIGGSEDATRKRIHRALQRLRAGLRRRGIAIPLLPLTALLTTHAVHAAPAALTVAITTSIPIAGACAGTTSVGLSKITGLHLMTLKAKIIGSTALIACLATPIVIQQRSINNLKNDQQALIAEHQNQIAALTGQISNPPSPQSAELSSEERQELIRLRGEAAALRKANQSLLVQQKPSVETNNTPQTSGEVPAEQADTEPRPEWMTTAAKLRHMNFTGRPISEEERKWLEDAKPNLEQLEKSPTEFARFQSSLIRETVTSLTDEKEQAIQSIIEETYQKAVAGKLVLSEKPEQDFEEWVARRHELDRAGTDQVQALLSPEELRDFNHRFLGIMGVDLGTGVDRANYPAGFLGPPPDRSPSE